MSWPCTIPKCTAVRGKKSQHSIIQAWRGVSTFRYQDVFEQPNKQATKFRKVTGDFVSTTNVNGKDILHVSLHEG